MSIRQTIDSLLRKLEKTYVTHNLIEVSGSALRHNVAAFGTASGLLPIPVLKGNAYGHGIIQVATALKSMHLPYIAVDGYFEALRIREVSKQPVLVMGAILPENFAKLKYDKFAFVVQDAATITALGNTGKRVKVHLECNTGMNRYGAQPAELTELTRLILSYPKLELEGLMSHLADSDGSSEATVSRAVALFDQCVEAVREAGATPTVIHIAQSAGSLRAHSKYATAMRLGIGTYGINPFPPGHRFYEHVSPHLRPALRLTSTLTRIIPLQKGDQVSYNYTYTAPQAMRLGVMPLGYHEGINRLGYSNAGVVTVNGKPAPVVGRVCMNHTMISLEGRDEVQVGDHVVIYSNDPAAPNSIDAVAARHNLFAYNLLTDLSPDIRRVLVD